jgi:hypothetical protein
MEKKIRFATALPEFTKERSRKNFSLPMPPIRGQERFVISDSGEGQNLAEKNSFFQTSRE